MFDPEFEKISKEVRDQIREYTDAAQNARDYLNIGQKDLDQAISHLAKINEQSVQENGLTLSVLGTTGAGKSTLINAILGMEVLPQSHSGICTAAVTRIRRSESRKFRVEVTYVSKESIENDIQRVKKNIDLLLASDESRNESLDDSSRNRLISIFGEEAVNKFEETGNTGVMKFSDDTFSRINRRKDHFDAHNPTELRKMVSNFLRVKDDLANPEEIQPWAIVQDVLITGDFAELPYGLELIDLPGLNDPNAAREQLTLEYVRKSKFLFVIYNFKRYETKDISSALSQEGLLEQIYGSNSPNALTFIATHCDAISPSADEREIYGKTSEGLAKFRRDSLEIHKTLKMRNFLKKEADRIFPLQNNQPSRFNQFFAESRIFTTSAKSFLDRNEGLAPTVMEEDSDFSINELRIHIKEIVSQEGPKALLGRVKNDFSITASKIESTISMQLTQNAAMARSNYLKLQEFQMHLQQINGTVSHLLDQATSSHKEWLRQTAEDLVSYIQLKPNTVEAFSRNFARYVNGIPWNTLAATVTSGGRYYSSGRQEWIDLRREISDPIQESCLPQTEFFYDNTLIKILHSYQDQIMSIVNSWTSGALEKVINDSDVALFQEIIERISKRIDDGWEPLQTELQDRFSKTLSEVVQNLNESTRGALTPYTDKASHERGAGMKKRICNILIEGADKCIREVFDFTRQRIREKVLVDIEFVLNHLSEINKMSNSELQAILQIFSFIEKHDDSQKPNNLEAILSDLQIRHERILVLNYQPSTNTSTSMPRFLFIDGSNVSTTEIDGRKTVNLEKLLECREAARKEFMDYEIITFVDPNYRSILEKQGDLESLKKFDELSLKETIKRIPGKGHKEIDNYADRYILEHAKKVKGIIVSRDNFGQPELRRDYPFVKSKKRIYSWSNLPTGVWIFTSLY